MQTLGGLVDQLQVINLKMWNIQEVLYKIRRMTLDEFKQEYSSDENLEELYNTFKKACDLNVQRNNVIDDIDRFFASTVEQINDGTVDTSRLIQDKHKTY